VRGDDLVLPCGQGRVGLLVHAERSFADDLVQRLFRELRGFTWKDEAGHERRLAPGVALVTCPENGMRASVLITAATEALERVLQGKGSYGYERVAVPSDTDEAEPHEKGARLPAYVDPLTGAIREERLPGVLQRFVARYRRAGQGVALLCLEVDQWPRYAEHYGEEGTQAILSGLGKLLDTSIRTSDLMARRGEHGYLIGLGCSLSEAASVAERLAEAIKGARFQTPRGTVKLTVSVGIAAYPEHGGVPRVLQEAAAVALEVAAGQGAQTRCVYEKSMRSPTLADQPVDSL
jgi:diguanylate cyclase (GGDEF)-like protein